VLGGGFDRAVPAPNRGLGEAIASRGLLLSEWAPAVSPDRWRFPQRNRLIAALSRATIIVEASATSGALHTANAAADLERPIGIVPGPVDSEAHRGSNRLLREPGVTAILEPGDALAFLGCRIESTEPPPQFSDDEARVWDVLANGGTDVDTIAIRAHLTTARCLAAITTLELAGAVECGLSGDVRRR
jgi:DNA processing protein